MAQRIPFRNRAHEVSRLEAFSDVIFGFALTLLVVSLEVPRNYEGFMEVLHGLLPFAVCFFMFITVWYQHHDFFKRYALQDSVTHVLNTILLFVVLFYVYPLKFVWVLSFNRASGITPEQSRVIFTVYGIGFAAVFALLALMFRHAYSQRDRLELNEMERIDTLERVLDNGAMAVVAVISIVLANILPLKLLGLAGYWYFVLAIPKTLIPSTMARRRREAEERVLTTNAETSPVTA